MPQSLACVWLHVVFSTKECHAYLQHAGFRDEMFRMIGHHVEQIGCVPIRVGGCYDHVHTVCGLSRTVTIASLVEHIKVETSKWAKGATRGVSTFSWQSGYGAFSVSQSMLPNVVDYVNDQAVHHAKRSFKEEFRELCIKHNLNIDERYVWD
ncbi:MAG: transposase [Planctomycetaceae bacterium]